MTCVQFLPCSNVFFFPFPPFYLHHLLTLPQRTFIAQPTPTLSSLSHSYYKTKALLLVNSNVKSEISPQTMLTTPATAGIFFNDILPVSNDQVALGNFFANNVVPEGQHPGQAQGTLNDVLKPGDPNVIGKCPDTEGVGFRPCALAMLTDEFGWGDIGGCRQLEWGSSENRQYSALDRPVASLICDCSVLDFPAEEGYGQVWGLLRHLDLSETSLMHPETICVEMEVQTNEDEFTHQYAAVCSDIESDVVSQRTLPFRLNAKASTVDLINVLGTGAGDENSNYGSLAFQIGAKYGMKDVHSADFAWHQCVVGCQLGYHPRAPSTSRNELTVIETVYGEGCVPCAAGTTMVPSSCANKDNCGYAYDNSGTPQSGVFITRYDFKDDWVRWWCFFLLFLSFSSLFQGFFFLLFLFFDHPSDDLRSFRASLLFSHLQMHGLDRCFGMNTKRGACVIGAMNTDVDYLYHDLSSSNPVVHSQRGEKPPPIHHFITHRLLRPVPTRSPHLKSVLEKGGSTMWFGMGVN